MHAGHKIGTPEVLFRNIADAEIAELRQRYAGSQGDRTAAAAAAAGSKPAKKGTKAGAAANKPSGDAPSVSPTEPSISEQTNGKKVGAASGLAPCVTVLSLHVVAVMAGLILKLPHHRVRACRRRRQRTSAKRSRVIRQLMAERWMSRQQMYRD